MYLIGLCIIHLQADSSDSGSSKSKPVEPVSQQANPEKKVNDVIAAKKSADHPVDSSVAKPVLGVRLDKNVSQNTKDIFPKKDKSGAPWKKEVKPAPPKVCFVNFGMRVFLYIWTSVWVLHTPNVGRSLLFFTFERFRKILMQNE